MKKIWTKDPEKIATEITSLMEMRSSLTLYQKGHPPQSITAEKIEETGQEKVVVLCKKASFQAPKDSCLFFYHPKNEAIRCFQTVPIKETETHLKTPFPVEIIQLQRRKNERITSKGMSKVVFTRTGSHHLQTGEIKDISVNGAKISGKFSLNIKQGDILAPVSITLRLRHGNFEEKINIPEAKVVRVIDEDKGARGLGISFVMPPTERDSFETYMTLRELEDKAL